MPDTCSLPLLTLAILLPPSLPQILAGLVDPPREFSPLFKALDELAGTANVSKLWSGFRMWDESA